MKFTKKLEANTRAVWAEHYMDYKALKKLLSFIITMQTNDSNGSDMPPDSPQKRLSRALLNPNELLEAQCEKMSLPLVEEHELRRDDGSLIADGSVFLRAVMAQWSRVEAFYESELARAEEQLATMLPLVASAACHRTATSNTAATAATAATATTATTAVPAANAAAVNGSGGSAPTSSAAIKSWHKQLSSHERSSIIRAVTLLYRELQHLRNFGILNYTGFVKILKKHDKSLPTKRIGSIAQPLLDAMPFVTSAGDAELLERLERAFADAFYDGNLQVARNELLVRKQRGESIAQLTLGLRLGFAASLLIWLVWDLLIDTNFLNLPSPRMHRWESFMQYQVPVYRFCGSLALGFYMWATVLYIWGKARINYLFMFELSPDDALTPAEAVSLGTRQLTICLLSLLLTTKSTINELPHRLPSGLFAAALFIASVASALMPLHRGKLFAVSTARVLLAPLVSVDLWSTFYADALTSLVKPTTDLCYSLCYIGSGEWLLSAREQGGCHDSARFNSIVMPLLCALPLWCRFMQNLRVYHDTRKRWPALPNALKYAISMLVVLFGALHPSVAWVATGAWVSQYGIPLVQAGWLSTYLISTLYTFFWDVFMDWRLGDLAHAGLRKRCMYRRKWLYYVAIGSDLILRFGWTTTLTPGEITRSMGGSAVAVQLARFAMMVAEMGRRSMWATLRLEAEHLHNTEGFRRVDIIPLHFDRKRDAAAEGGRGEADAHARYPRKTFLILELLGYVALVTILAMLSALFRPQHAAAAKP